MYTLSFLDSALQPVTTLPTGGPELILKGHVEDGSGTDATVGSITFEYCSLKGLPPNDITRADEAPKEACDITGDGAWTRLLTLKVDLSGNAMMDFGFVQIPRTIGFRIRYSAQGGSIARGISESQNFTWQ